MMIKIFGRRHAPKVDPDELDRQTAEINEYLKENEPRMKFVANWLDNRRGQNGLGEDFDVTFYPRGA